MRHYDVTAYTYINRKFVGVKEAACWAIFKYSCNFNPSYKTDDKFFHNKVVYIANFDEEETRKYQTLLISTINKITPCRIVKKPNKQKFIRLRLLKSYDQSLIVLNFIRNLWHEPTEGYTSAFFEALSKAKQKDRLERLTWANKEACAKNLLYSPGHSNAHKKELLKVKNSKQLLKYKGNCTYTFLTT